MPRRNLRQQMKTGFPRFFTRRCRVARIPPKSLKLRFGLLRSALPRLRVVKNLALITVVDSLDVVAALHFAFGSFRTALRRLCRLVESISHFLASRVWLMVYSRLRFAPAQPDICSGRGFLVCGCRAAGGAPVTGRGSSAPLWRVRIPVRRPDGTSTPPAPN